MSGTKLDVLERLPNIGGATRSPNIREIGCPGVQAVLPPSSAPIRSDALQDMVDGRACRSKADAPELTGRDMTNAEKAGMTQCLFSTTAGYKLGGNLECEVRNLIFFIATACMQDVRST
jgi:hypothetical protein